MTTTASPLPLWEGMKGRGNYGRFLSREDLTREEEDIGRYKGSRWLGPDLFSRAGGR